MAGNYFFLSTCRGLLTTRLRRAIPPPPTQHTPLPEILRTQRIQTSGCPREFVPHTALECASQGWQRSRKGFERPNASTHWRRYVMCWKSKLEWWNLRTGMCVASERAISSYHLHDAFTVVTVGHLQQLPEMNETLFVSFWILLHFCFIPLKFSFFVSFFQKNCLILFHSCFILLPSCFILLHSSFIPHSACFILLHSSFILFHSFLARFSFHSICFILLGQYFNGLKFSK